MDSLLLLDAACNSDVAFHNPIDGHDGSSSCSTTSISVSTYDLKYEEIFLLQRKSANRKTYVRVSAIIFRLL